MLNIFDWMRRSRSGAELLATLEYSVTDPDLFPTDGKIGPPFSAFDSPCQRCWIYPCMIFDNADRKDLPAQSSKLRVYEPSVSNQNYCRSCQAITDKARNLGKTSRHAVVIWGFVNHVPDQLQNKKGFYADKLIGSYVHDDNHFLMIITRRELKMWLQEVLIYHGSNLRGLIQIFPTVGDGKRGTMGEILCRAIHQEARFPMDILRVRFFSRPFQIFTPHARDEEGLLTFEVTEFLRLLEMAEIFRSILRPDEQKALHELIHLSNKREEQFYWGDSWGI